MRRKLSIVLGAILCISMFVSCGEDRPDAHSGGGGSASSGAIETGCPLVTTEAVSQATGVEWVLLDGFPFIDSYSRKECTFTLASDTRSAEEVVGDLGGDSLAIVIERKDVGDPCAGSVYGADGPPVPIAEVGFDGSVPIEGAGLAQIDGQPLGAFACTQDLVVRIADIGSVLAPQQHLDLLAVVVNTGAFVELMARNEPEAPSSIQVTGQIQGTMVLENIECTDLGDGGLFMAADGQMGEQNVSFTGSDEVNDDGTVGKILGQVGDVTFSRSSDITFAADAQGLRFDNSEINVVTGDDVLEGTSSGSLFFTGEANCP